MAALDVRRVLFLTLLSVLHCINIVESQTYEIVVAVQPLKPKGIRVSIPDKYPITLFAFQGNVNSPINDNDVGSISGEILQPTNGRWVFEDTSVQLNTGDVVNYYIHVSLDGVGTLIHLGSRVIALEDFEDLEYRNNILPPTTNPVQSTIPTIPPPTPGDPIKSVPGTKKPGVTGTPTPKCRTTATVIRQGVACAGQLIFNENFNTLNKDVWTVEQYVPFEQPDYPFNSYQPSAVSIESGTLKISPTFQERQRGFNKDSIISGSLNLYDGCTLNSAQSCYLEASGPSILPPVVSGRVSSKGFAFTYGIVEVKAKFPLGDWLYPDILLQPLMNKYGHINQASGLFKIATARGNDILYRSNVQYNNKVLYGGPIINSKCHNALFKKKISTVNWGEDFHVYSIRWAPERITLSVDGIEWARFEPAASGLRGRLPKNCTIKAPFLPVTSATDISPFDDAFYITLGLSVGGITEFPDGAKTGGEVPKPWHNQDRKGLLNFWRDKYNWLPTWTHPELLVDYVRVYAL